MVFTDGGMPVQSAEMASSEDLSPGELLAKFNAKMVTDGIVEDVKVGLLHHYRRVEGQNRQDQLGVDMQAFAQNGDVARCLACAEIAGLDTVATVKLLDVACTNACKKAKRIKEKFDGMDNRTVQANSALAMQRAESYKKFSELFHNAVSKLEEVESPNGQ